MRIRQLPSQITNSVLGEKVAPRLETQHTQNRFSIATPALPKTTRAQTQSKQQRQLEPLVNTDLFAMKVTDRFPNSNRGFVKDFPFFKDSGEDKSTWISSYQAD